MRSDFQEDSLNEQIAKRGYAIVPFANAEEIDQISTFYKSLPPTGVHGTHVTMFHPSSDYRKEVDQKIKHLFEQRAAGFLKNYRALFANFMVKAPGEEGDFPVHQDWSYVDETRFASYAFWIPMQDVNSENGTLNVVPGSQKYWTALRGPGVHDPFRKLSEVIKSKYSIPIELKAGEALVWDHRLIHFSRPNLSQYPRLAFTLIMVPEGIEVFHCFERNGHQSDDIEIYAVNTDFYFSNIIGQPPTGVKQIGRISQLRQNLSPEQFEKLWESNKG